MGVHTERPQKVWAKMPRRIARSKVDLHIHFDDGSSTPTSVMLPKSKTSRNKVPPKAKQPRRFREPAEPPTLDSGIQTVVHPRHQSSSDDEYMPEKQTRKRRVKPKLSPAK